MSGKFATDLTGGANVTVFEGGTIAEAVAAAEAAGDATLYVTAGGRFLVYIPGAPDFVNANFVQHFTDGAIPPSTPMVVMIN